MFYLIGVNHNAQRHPCGATLDKDQEELQRRLNEAIDDHHPELIAVEESVDTLLNDESIPRNAAEQHGIEAMLCEPSNDEKRRIGYMAKPQIGFKLSACNCPPSLEKTAADAVEIALNFPLREEFWLEKLKEHLRSEVIFVLGDDHIDSFSRRLQTLGIQDKVLVRGIGVTEARRAESEAARRFPIESPELFGAILQGMVGNR